MRCHMYVLSHQSAWSMGLNTSTLNHHPRLLSTAWCSRRRQLRSPREQRVRFYCFTVPPRHARPIAPLRPISPTGPVSVPCRSFVGSVSVPYRFRVGSVSTHCQFRVDPVSILCRSRVGPVSIPCRSRVGPVSVPCRSRVGPVSAGSERRPKSDCRPGRWHRVPRSE